MSITLKNINKSFGKTMVIDSLSLTIETGEMMALLGPSGSGKTTLLRIISGLDCQNKGSLYFDDQDVSRLAAKDRNVGFVFQNYALFRHMTVFDNIAFGLTVVPRHKRLHKAAIVQRVMQLLEMIQLPHLKDRYPSQLSGGQKQRVALARALAVEPKILLLDEPFGALDTQVRSELRSWLRQLHRELKFTSVFVTHDQEEAMEVASRVVIMREGYIEQIDTPEKITQQPANRFVMEFLGQFNHWTANVVNSRLIVGNNPLPFSLVDTSINGDIDLFVRPWDLKWQSQTTLQSITPAALPVTVIDSHWCGHYWQLTLMPKGWISAPIRVVWQHNAQLTPPDCGENGFLIIKNGYAFQGERAVAIIEQR